MISKQEKGVSPVIGVILMVAITVIIAAVVANFVLNLGSNLEQQADATVTFSQEVDDFSGPEYAVTVTVSRMDNADYLVVTTRGGAGDAFPDVANSTAPYQNKGTKITYSGPSPSDVSAAPNSAAFSQSVSSASGGAVLVSSGDVTTVGGLKAGDVVQVFGGLKGKENLINSYEVKNTLG